MKHIIQLFTLLLLTFFYNQSFAQEINAKVTIQVGNLQQTEPAVFKTLETEVRDFINNRRWTDENYKPEERIDCNVLITIIKELSPTRFEARFAIQSSRPVYNSSYNSPIFTYQDKFFTFDYAQFDPIQFNEGIYTSELSSVIAYYMYMVLAIDGDTFSSNGGTAAFNKVQQVITGAQNSPYKGWKGHESTDNRYWLLDNILSGRFVKMRQANYQYHRLGLDNMYSNATEGRNNILNALAIIEKLRKDNPNGLAIDLFVNTKSDELMGLFNNAKVSPSEKSRAVNSLSRIDPANENKYSALNNISGGTDPNMGDMDVPSMMGDKKLEPVRKKQ